MARVAGTQRERIVACPARRVPDLMPLRWGRPAPDFEVPSTEGRVISLREFRGRDVGGI